MTEVWETPIGVQFESTVDLIAGSPEETEAIIEKGDTLMEELNDERHLEFIHAAGLESFLNHLKNDYKGTMRATVLIDAMRTLGPGLALKIHHEDVQAPNEYVWSNGHVGFVGVSSRESACPELSDYDFARMVHFIGTYPVSLWRNTSDEVPIDTN
jgi:hypothetical protein